MNENLHTLIRDPVSAQALIEVVRRLEERVDELERRQSES